jgi:hypothetical protein
MTSSSASARSFDPFDARRGCRGLVRAGIDRLEPDLVAPRRQPGQHLPSAIRPSTSVEENSS